MFTIERSNALQALNYAVLQYNGNCSTIEGVRKRYRVFFNLYRKKVLDYCKLPIHFSNYPFTEH